MLLQHATCQTTCDPAAKHESGENADQAGCGDMAVPGSGGLRRGELQMLMDGLIGAGFDREAFSPQNQPLCVHVTAGLVLRDAWLLHGRI